MANESDYKNRVTRLNLERQKYVRDKVAQAFSEISETFSGVFQVEIPVSRGVIGKIRVTKTEQQPE
jgi:hypothetical protein